MKRAILMLALLALAGCRDTAYQSGENTLPAPEQAIIRELGGAGQKDIQPAKRAPEFGSFNLHKRHGLGGWDAGRSGGNSDE